MIRPDGLTICDADKRFHHEEWHGMVVSDGKTVLPGMLEVKEGKVYEHVSSDPAGLHRIKDDAGNNHLDLKLVGDYPDKKISAHFCNSHCYAEWAENELLNKKAKKRSKKA